MSRSPAEDALVSRLLAIPKGGLAQVAQRAGMDLPALMRLKRGEQTNVRLQTLEKIARGLGEPIGVMLGEGPATTRPAPPALDYRGLERLAKSLNAARVEAEKLLAAAEARDEAQQLARRSPPQTRQ